MGAATESGLVAPVQRSAGTSSCPEGVPDLGMSSQAGTFTLTSLGLAPLGDREYFLGAPVRTTGMIEFCVPDDVVSLVIMAPGSYFSSFETPGDGELIDTSSSEAYVASPARPSDVPALLHPMSPDRPATGGVHRFSLAVWTGKAPEIFVGIRRGAEPEQVSMRVNLVFVEDGLTREDVAAVSAGAEEFRRIFGDAGVEIQSEGPGVGVIRDPSLVVLDDIDVGYDALVRSTVDEPRPDSPLAADAVNVYLVRELMNEHGALLGYASGIPGFVGFRGEGVLVATAGHRRADGSLDVNDLAITLAHETGHFLGLGHTSESDGLFHDIVSDTPECSAAQDGDADGMLSLGECEGRDAGNLMFWLGYGHRLSAEQAAILRASPLAHPLES